MSFKIESELNNLQTTQGCRLCNGFLQEVFCLRLLGKYDVAYYQCSECGSLQTEAPYWLDEAYSKSNLSNTDTGAAQRALQNLSACLAISRLLKARNLIDIGGGDGLLCRLLRDYNLNCYVKDKYAALTYAQGFTEQNFDMPDLIVGFEVLEHFPNPMKDLDDLFSYNANALLLSTAIYTNEKKDWWYVAPETGQHVFFYSKKALELIAKKYGYSLVISDTFILFVKNISAPRKILARQILRNSALHVLKAFVLLLPTPGIWRDHRIQVEKSKQTIDCRTG